MNITTIGRALRRLRLGGATGPLLVAVIAANLLGQIALEEPVDALRCLNPTRDAPCVYQPREHDRLPETVLGENETHFRKVDRAQPYVELRRSTPNAEYLLASPAPHIWRASTTLLATAAGARNVIVLDPQIAVGAALILGETLDKGATVLEPQTIVLDLAAGSNYFLMRLIAGEGRQILMYDSGKQIVVIDVELLPRPLKEQLQEAHVAGGGR